MTTTAAAPDLVPAPPWAVRPEMPLDLDQIHELHREAFRGPTEAELVDAIRAGPNFVAELSLVAATPDGSVLGHVLLSRIVFEPQTTDEVAADALVLAPLAVLLSHHGRGIGTALMREALATADRRGEALIAVLGAPSFYGRFGFVPAATHDVTSPYSDAGEANQVRQIGDRPIQPGILVYPPMFEAVSG